MNIKPYSWLLLAGIIFGAVFWARLARRDSRLFVIYFSALCGAFLGAKIVYFFAEGYQHVHDPDFLLQLATGKTIIGGLLGGYVTVEITKAIVGYEGTTGDWFAFIAPIGILLGRVGCLVHGCCLGVVCNESWFTLRDHQGVARWPAVPIEIAFNIIAAATFFVLRQRRILPGQHFHLYLIAYGAFRCLHEFVREEPIVLGGFTGYQLAALLLCVFGIAAFVGRRNATATTSEAGRFTSKLNTNL